MLQYLLTCRLILMLWFFFSCSHASRFSFSFGFLIWMFMAYWRIVVNENDFFFLPWKIHFQLQVQFTTLAAHFFISFLLLLLYFFDVQFVAVIMRNLKARISRDRRSGATTDWIHEKKVHCAQALSISHLAMHKFCLINL